MAKLKAIKHQHYGRAMDARVRLDLVYKNRDSLVQRESLRSWCCGGKHSSEYEVEMESLY